MAKIVMIGGGVAGLIGSVLLARDGHHVTLLERDPAPPPAPTDAWDRWERRGVTQFRLPHAFLPRFREILDHDLPDVVAALESDGALRYNRIRALPERVTGGWRDGDERFDQVTGRRPMIEAALARVAAAEPGVEIRRGAAVRGLTTGRQLIAGVPHVTGVTTVGGAIVAADLVVDASGRRSALGDHLAAIGGRRPAEQHAAGSFVYYARHYRSSDGSLPALLGAPLLHHDSVSTLTAVADSGYWSVVLFTSARDAALRACRDAAVWERVVGAFGSVAQWIDAEPVTGIDRIAGIADRSRRLVLDRQPIVTGLVAVGDASTCTSPALGRGASMAALHVSCLRDVLASVGSDLPIELMHAFDAATAAVVTPLIDDTLRIERHRLAQVDAQMAGADYTTDDPAWAFASALRSKAMGDPEVLRAAVSIESLLARGVEVAGRADIVERLRAVDPVPASGPTRAELVSLAGGGRSRALEPALR